jgi:predicted Rossmann fold flavoprotein
LGNEQTKVCIIGAGPAGLMAAIFSAKAGAETFVIEANKSPGQKLLLTGGGRCNLTHRASPKELVRAFRDKGRFLSFSLHRFSSQYIQDFFAHLGLRIRIEKDGCVFPASDRAGDVRDILLAEAKKLGVRFIFSAKIQSIAKHGECFTIERAGQKILAEKVIIATGGLSYPSTGSTGDGYRFAQHFGHTIIGPQASLVPLVTLENWPSELAGTSLDNVKITASLGKKKIVTTGAMLFTHDGISGPAALELSRLITNFLPNEKNPIKISIDLVSNIDETVIEKVILKQIGEHPKKIVANILAEIVPRHVSQILCWLLDLPENLSANQLNKDMRKKLLHFLKSVPLSIVRTRPIAEAMVTRGGVNITEIEPKTMESRICPGLFFAGEVIDVDGPCGGYNLQMCWSTGALAGLSAARSK